MAQTQAFEARDGHCGAWFVVKYLEKALVTYLLALANESQSAEAELSSTQAADHQLASRGCRDVRRIRPRLFVLAADVPLN